MPKGLLSGKVPEVLVEKPVSFPPRALRPRTICEVLVTTSRRASRFLTDMTLCRDLQRNRVGVELLSQQEILQPLHLPRLEGDDWPLRRVHVEILAGLALAVVIGVIALVFLGLHHLASVVGNAR